MLAVPYLVFASFLGLLFYKYKKHRQAGAQKD